MGNVPVVDLRRTQVLARLGVAAGSLGIDPAPLDAATKELVGTPLRITLDMEGGLVLRYASHDALAARPADSRFREIQSQTGRTELIHTDLAIGTRPFADDVALIGGATAALAERLAAIGAGRCDALARRLDGEDVRCIASVIAPPAPAADLIAAVTGLTTLAGELGVSALQCMLLENAHLQLGTNGYWTSLACDGTRVLPEIALEYRDVSWEHAVGLTNTLLGTRSGDVLGKLAGAFNVDRAAAMAITYRQGHAPNVRISIEPPP